MNRDPRGYYAALGVAPDATPEDLQRAFRAQMRRRHPDVAAADPAAAGSDGRAQGRAGATGDEVRLILEAYAVLRDPGTRAVYDPAAAHPSARTNAGRDIPVRHHRGGPPLLRVTPVRWERGSQ